jgi:hypothetical protein
MPFNLLLASLGHLLGRVFRVENFLLLVSLFSVFGDDHSYYIGGQYNTNDRPRKRGRDY